MIVKNRQSLLNSFFLALKRVGFRREKRLLPPIYLIPALLLSSTLALTPGSQAFEIQNESNPSSSPVKLLGMWPYGQCQASAVDATRNIALIGNGETLQVLDISTPSSPIKKGELNLKGSPQDIMISGNYAYLVTLSYLKIVDISVSISPHEVASIYFDETELKALDFSSGYVYVAANEQGLYIYDVSDPSHPSLQSRYSRPELQVTDVEIWGNYAIYECAYWKFPEHPEWTYGVEAIDVSYPSAPALAGTYKLKDDYVPRGLDVSGDGFAYSCQYSSASNKSKIIVIDVAADPKNLVEAGRYVRAGKDYKGITLSEDYAYLIENWPCHLVVMDISTPISPFYIGECETDFGPQKLDISGSLVGIAQAGDGFSLYSISVPSSPTWLGSYDTPDTAGGVGNGIVVSGDYVYLASYSEGLRIMDISDPSNPALAGICELWGGVNLYGGVALSGNYAYCNGNTDRQEFFVVDISSPYNPRRVAYLDLPCAAPPCDAFQYMAVDVRMPYAFLSGTKWTSNSTRAILAVLDISDLANLSVVGTFECPFESNNYGNFGLSGNYIYLPIEDFSKGEDDRRSGLLGIDISDPKNPRIAYRDYSTVTGSYSSDVTVRGNYAYLTGDMLWIYDISNPAVPKWISFFPSRCNNLAVSGDYAYLAWDKLKLVDISNPYHPFGIPGYEGEWGKGVAVSGNRVYVPGSLYILKNTLAPHVSITSPSSLSTLLGSVFIQAKASHSTGIDKVEFYIDGSLKTTDRTSPYSYNWDTTSFEDGLHKIRAQAYNNNGVSSEAEIEVFTKLVYSPLNFTGEKILNRSFSQSEYINVLSWQAHPDNVNIVKYKIFLVDGESQSLLVELSTDTFEYWHRGIEPDKSYTYALVAVSNEGKESEPVYITVQ